MFCLPSFRQEALLHLLMIHFHFRMSHPNIVSFPPFIQLIQGEGKLTVKMSCGLTDRYLGYSRLI